MNLIKKVMICATVGILCSAPSRALSDVATCKEDEIWTHDSAPLPGNDDTCNTGYKYTEKCVCGQWKTTHSEHQEGFCRSADPYGDPGVGTCLKVSEDTTYAKDEPSGYCFPYMTFKKTINYSDGRAKVNPSCYKKGEGTWQCEPLQIQYQDSFVKNGSAAEPQKLIDRKKFWDELVPTQCKNGSGIEKVTKTPKACYWHEGDRNKACE